MINQVMKAASFKVFLGFSYSTFMSALSWVYGLLLDVMEFLSEPVWEIILDRAIGIFTIIGWITTIAYTVYLTIKVRRTTPKRDEGSE